MIRIRILTIIIFVIAVGGFAGLKLYNFINGKRDGLELNAVPNLKIN